MALDNIHDKTMASFFDSLVHYINPPKVNRQGANNGHMQASTGSTSTKSIQHGYYNNGHSYEFNRFADHHQYNVMDYVRWLNIRGQINYRPENAQETEFSLNPDAPDHTHSMKSVDIKIRRTKAQYKGKPIYQAVFFRNSEPQEGGAGMPYGPGDGFDELANFMLMFHNNYADSRHYLVPQLYKHDPRTKRIMTNKYGHKILNKRTANWVDNQRKRFIQSYHAQWKTYRSAFETTGMNFNYQVEHKRNSIKPARRSYIHTKESRSHQPTGSVDKYKDRGFAKDTKCYQGNLEHNYFYKHSSARRYFHNDRGLADNLIYSLLKQDRLRSYNGEIRMKIVPCHNNKQAMELQKKFRGGGHYHTNKHYFVGIMQNYHPCVEFPWKQAKMRVLHATPKQVSKLIGTHDNIWSYTNGKLDNSGLVSLPVKKNKYGQYVFKDNPNVRAEIGSAYQNSNSLVYSIKGAYVKEPVQQYDLKHQKTVGADRIYLKGDRRTLSKPYKHKDGSVTFFYSGKGKADYSLFSRGKQIAKNSKYGFGWNFSTMNDTVHPRRNELFVFEDPIDALSYYNLHNDVLRHKNCTFLSLGGVGKSYAINDFLKSIDAQPGEFSKVHLCFDNDRAGYQGTEQIMASNKNKVAYVRQGQSVSINPVTHTKQSIDVRVPNVHMNVITKKMVPTSVKGTKVKDFNDVCQYIRQLNKYQHVGHKAAYKMYEQPDSAMNINDYSQMITDKYLNKANTLSDLGRNNGKYMQELFTQYDKVGQEYQAEQATLNKMKWPILQKAKELGRQAVQSDKVSDDAEERYLKQPANQSTLNATPQVSADDKHVKAMYKAFHQMDKVGQDTFMSFMGLAGGKSLSPHDLMFYAGHHGKFAKSPQTAYNLDINPQSFKPSVEHSVNYTASRLSSVQNRQKYTLALQSLKLMMPYYRDKTARKPLSPQQCQDVKVGSLIYQNVVGSIRGNSLGNMLDADEINRSIQEHIEPAYAKNKHESLDTAISAAYKKGPMTLRDWYQEQSEAHRPVIKNINQCIRTYRTSILNARHRHSNTTSVQRHSSVSRNNQEQNKKYLQKYGMSQSQVARLIKGHHKMVQDSNQDIRNNRRQQKVKSRSLRNKIRSNSQQTAVKENAPQRSRSNDGIRRS